MTTSWGTRMAQWARAYEERHGWQVMPTHILKNGQCTCGDVDCDTPGKHLDLARYGDWDERGIAVLCGASSGVIGINVQDGSVGSRGWRTLVEEWIAGDAGSEGTLTVQTPSGDRGGRIFLWRLPAGVNVAADRMALEPGVTLLGDGTWAVLPPTPGWAWAGGASGAEKVRDVPHGLLIRIGREGALEGRLPSLVDNDNPYRVEAGGGAVDNRSLSDIGNGRRIVDEWGDTFSFTEGIGWRVWLDGRWTDRLAESVMSEKGKELPWVLRREREHLEKLVSSGAGGPGMDALKARVDRLKKHESRSRDMGAVTRALAAARTDPRIVRGADGWDTNPTLFGVPNGVVDLETGELRPPERNLWISRSGHIVYDPSALGPRGSGRGTEFWDFIDFITSGDQDLADELQLLAGYSLTGLMREKMIMFCPGRGNTGKSTFSDMMTGACGTYATVLDSRLINLNDRYGNVETSTLSLAGARLAVAPDIPLYDFNVDFLKKLSGGDTLTGRAMRQNQVSFVSAAKLWIFSNHFPTIKDRQLMERLRVIPFDNVSRDVNRRRSGWTQPQSWTGGRGEHGNGIMRASVAWLVSGAREAIRLGEIPSSHRAVAEKERYRRSSDVFFAYMSERLRFGEDYSVSFGAMYHDFTMWCMETRMVSSPPNRPAFENMLRENNIGLENGIGVGMERLVRGVALALSIPSAIA